MNPEIIKQFLLYNLIANYGVLLVWFGVFYFAHEKLYLLHSKWFKLSSDSFDKLHYGSMAIYTIGIILLNVAPLLGLCIVF